MLTQIWSSTDILFCHFRSFFALLPHYLWPQKFGKNVKNTWRYYPFTNVHRKSRYVWATFCPFTPPSPHLNNPKKKNEKNPRDIILHKCNVNHNHMIWYMVPKISTAKDRYFSSIIIEVIRTVLNFLFIFFLR